MTTTTITRRTGSVEVYENGKLVSETSPSGEAVVRVNLQPIYSGGSSYSPSTPTEVSQQQSVVNLEKEMGVSVSEAQFYSNTPIITGASGTTNVVVQETPSVETRPQYSVLPSQKYSPVYGLPSNIVVSDVVRGVKYDVNRERFISSQPVENRRDLSFFIPTYSQARKKNMSVERFVGGVGSPLGVAVDVSLNPSTLKAVDVGNKIVEYVIPVQEAFEGLGYVTGDNEYRDYYNSPLRKETSVFIESESNNVLNRQDIKGYVDLTDIKQVGGLGFGGFVVLSREEKQSLLYDVYEKFKSKGLSDELAYKYTGFALRETKFRELGEFEELIVINAVSNRFAGELYSKSLSKSLSLGLSPLKATGKAITYSMPLGGAFEGGFGVVNYESSRLNKISYVDVGMGALVGGASASLIQAGISYPSAFVSQKFTGNFGQLAGRSIFKGSSQSAYLLDPIGEPLGDLADYLTSGSGFVGRSFRVNTNVFAFTEGFSVSRNKVSYSSFVLSPSQKSSEFVGATYSFTFSNPLSSSNVESNNFGVVPSKSFNYVSNFVQTKERSLGVFNNNFVSSFNNPNSLVNVNPNPFVNVNNLPSAFVFVNPNSLVNVNNNIFTNPLNNVNPLVNVNPNPFVNTFGKFPIIPFLPLRGFGGGSLGFGRRSKRKNLYTPSLSALGFNIRAKKQRNELTGIGIRPIVGG